MTPPWDAVFAALFSWRKSLETLDPSVTLVAQNYSHDPWAVLASTLLSLRTKDEVTLVTSKALLAQCPGPRETLKADISKIEKLIYPAGFYKTKALRLKEIARIVLEKYDGKVPDTLEALLSLPGVGRKTANLVLIEAFDKDGVCVDTHVHRITNRAGWLTSKRPDETESILRKILPRKFWKSINAMLVLYGQRVCKPQSPFCSRCCLVRFCEKRGVERSR